MKVWLAPSPDQGHFVLHQGLGTEVKFALWVAPALLAIAAAFRPAGRDGFGFEA